MTSFESLGSVVERWNFFPRILACLIRGSCILSMLRRLLKMEDHAYAFFLLVAKPIHIVLLLFVRKVLRFGPSSVLYACFFSVRHDVDAQI